MINMNKIITKKILISALLLILFVLPVVVFAQSQGGATKLVPCDGVDCDVDDFMTLVFNVINFVIFLGVIFSSLVFAYAGFLYITAQGDTTKVQKATKMFTGVAVGLFLAFTAFLIIQLITSTLGLNEGDNRDIPIEIK